MELLLRELPLQPRHEVGGLEPLSHGLDRVGPKGLGQAEEALSDVRPHGGPCRGEDRRIGRPGLERRIDPGGPERLPDVVPDRPQHEASVVAVLSPGDLAGDQAFLSADGTGSLELSALVPTRGVTVDAWTLWSLAGERPAVARFLLRRLSGNAHRLRRRAAVLRSLEVRDR